MIQRERIHLVNEQEVVADGQVVVYWMQQAQRAEFNHASTLAYAPQSQPLDLMVRKLRPRLERQSA